MAKHTSFCATKDQVYSREIFFRPNNTVDISSLTSDEQRLLHHCLDENANSGEMSIGEFLSKHGNGRLRDLGVEMMRYWIPRLFMYAEHRGGNSCRKVKGLWDERPDSWPPDVPFVDPNNRKRSAKEDGLRGKKPTKKELLLMLDYLIKICKEQGPGRERSLSTPMSCGSVPASSSVFSPRSVQTVGNDDIEAEPLSEVSARSDMDADMAGQLSPEPLTAEAGRVRSAEVSHASSSAALNLADALQRISLLPSTSADRALIMNVYGLLDDQNRVELTLAQVNDLKQDAFTLQSIASLLYVADSGCQSFPRLSDSDRHKLDGITEKYGRDPVLPPPPPPPPAEISVPGRVMDGSSYNGSDEPCQLASGSSSLQSNPSSYPFFPQIEKSSQDALLNDINSVIGCADHCDDGSESSGSRRQYCSLDSSLPGSVKSDLDGLLATLPTTCISAAFGSGGGADPLWSEPAPHYDGADFTVEMAPLVRCQSSLSFGLVSSPWHSGPSAQVGDDLAVPVAGRNDECPPAEGSLPGVNFLGSVPCLVTQGSVRNGTSQAVAAPRSSPSQTSLPLALSVWNIRPQGSVENNSLSRVFDAFRRRQSSSPSTDPT